MQACGSDDRETPLVALKDLTSVIDLLFQEPLCNIRVYDPYYCKGAIISSLGQCGFAEKNIFNEKKDCYAVQKRKEVPKHDIVITNPPYSGTTTLCGCNYDISYCDNLNLTFPI